MQSPSNQGLLKQMDGISLKVLRFPRKKVETYFQMDNFIDRMGQEFRREGWTEKRSAVHFCLGSGLFGSYNSD